MMTFRRSCLKRVEQGDVFSSSEFSNVSRNAENRPISDGRSGTGNSYVFRHPVLRTEFRCLLPESGR
jgi:hypothetical protein